MAKDTKAIQTAKAVGYTSQADLLGDLLQWRDSSLPLPKTSAHTEFAHLVARLQKTSVKRFPLARIIRENALNTAELFVLLRAVYLKYAGAPVREETVAAYLNAGKAYIPRKELLKILFDKKSILCKQKILSIGRELVILNQNPIKTDTPKPKTAKPRILNPRKVLADLNKYVIGQAEAAELLVAGAFEHLAKCNAEAKDKIQRTKNNIFLSGGSGCGKTYLCQKLAQILNIPFVHADMTKYTCSGYKGLEIGSVFQPLFPKEGNKLPLSIVLLDEIDKLIGPHDTNAFREETQTELLRILESNSVTVESGLKTTRTWDISQVLFVACGAFTRLLEKRTTPGIGFASDKAANTNKFIPQTEDFIRYGLKRELVGRFGYFAHLNPLGPKELEKILLNPHGGPIQQYRSLFPTGREIVFKKQIKEIISQAVSRGLGARGLNQQVHYLFQKEFLNHNITLAN